MGRIAHGTDGNSGWPDSRCSVAKSIEQNMKGRTFSRVYFDDFYSNTRLHNTRKLHVLFLNIKK